VNNILITGGAGFIGSHLVDHLLNEESEIYVIDNFFNIDSENNQKLLNSKNVKLINHDINDISNTFLNNIKFDLIYHFAANSDISISFKNPWYDINNTLNTTISILEFARKNNCNNLIFASTSAIFGEVDAKINEDYGPLKPISHYGAAKLASEAFMSSYSSNYNLNILIVRFPNVVGGNSTHGVLYDFINKIKNNSEFLEVLGDGEQEKSYIHVHDLIDAIQYIWKYKKSNFEIYNIGNIDTIKVKDIAKLVIELCGQYQKIVFTGSKNGWIGDVVKFRYDINKLINIGWSPKYNSEEAIKKSIYDQSNSYDNIKNTF